MKSTKSIFVVALAALMLVAFTACQPGNTTINNVNGTPISATVTSQDPIYAGTTGTAKAVVTVLYDNGTIVENVNAEISYNSPAVPGEQSGKVKIAVKDGTTPAEVSVVYNVTAATSITLDASKAKTEYKTAEISSKPVTTDVVATVTYADEHTIVAGGTSGPAISYAFNAKDGSATAVVGTINNVTADGSVLEAEYAIEVTDYTAPTTTTTIAWKVQVADEDGEFTDYNATSNKPEILYGQEKADLLKKIRVLQTTTTTTGADKDEVETVLSEGSDYVIQGIASGKLTAAGTFSVVALKDLTGDPAITFTDATISYDVTDATDWGSLEVKWADNPTNVKVGGTLSKTPGTDVAVTLKQLSGNPITQNITISYIGISSYPETDYKEGDSVTPVVKVTYGGESSEPIQLPSKQLAAKSN